MTERDSKNWKDKKVIAIIVILLSSIAVGAFLYTQHFLKPEFNIFDVESPTKFNIQNIGKADAHNVKIEVNGTWVPTIEINVTSVEYGEHDTLFNGRFDGSFEDMNILARRIIPSVAGMERDSEHAWLKIFVIENEMQRCFNDSEAAILIEAFENPRAYYTFGETTIDILRMGEVKTVQITLKGRADYYDISISCDEEVTLQFCHP